MNFQSGQAIEGVCVCVGQTSYSKTVLFYFTQLGPHDDWPILFNLWDVSFTSIKRVINMTIFFSPQ